LPLIAPKKKPPELKIYGAYFLKNLIFIMRSVAKKNSSINKQYQVVLYIDIHNIP